MALRKNHALLVCVMLHIRMMVYIKSVCMSPKAAETRALMKLVDDATNQARQVSHLMSLEVKTRIFTDSRPLLKSI